MNSSSKLVVFVSVLMLSGCNTSSENDEVSDNSNWHMVQSPSDVDPFTKVKRPSSCYVQDKLGEYYISTMRIEDEQNLLVLFKPKNLDTLILDHADELSRIRRYLSGLRDGNYASAGVHTHARLASASGNGQVISQMGNKTRTPLVYPYEVKFEHPRAKDEYGLEFDFEGFCAYSMLDNAGNLIKRGKPPRRSGCNLIKFQLALSDVKLLTDESIKLNNSKYVLRLDTYVSHFDEQRPEFYLISHVRGKTYDYQVDLTGLAGAVQDLTACDNPT